MEKKLYNHNNEYDDDSRLNFDLVFSIFRVEQRFGSKARGGTGKKERKGAWCIINNVFENADGINHWLLDGWSP